MRDTPHLLDATMFWNASGGVRRYVMAKRDWLAGHTGWRHSVATPTPEPGEPDMLTVPSLPLPGSNGAYRLPWQRGACARQIVAARPDLIESADPYRLAWASLDAARALGVPAVAFSHSNLERMGELAAGRVGRIAARRYAARLYRRFDLVLAPSRAMVAHLHDWGVPAAVHQPLGVATEVFHPGARDAGLRARLGLAPEKRLLVFAGRCAPEKHLQTLADATDRLGDGYRLLLIGEGPAAPQGERVVRIPAVREPSVLAGLLAACDVFVHAGDQETFGLSVLEAMACGLPVVARAAEGLAELVDATVGRGVVDGRVESFAAAIDAVFAEGSARLGAAARQRARAHDWARVLPVLCGRYRRLIGGAVDAEPSAREVAA